MDIAMTHEPQQQGVTFRKLLVSKVESDTSSRTSSDRFRSPRLIFALATAGILVIGAVGAGVLGLPGRSEPITVSSATPGEKDSTQNLADENLATDPRELAAGAQVVVFGTVIGVEEIQAPPETPQPNGVVTTFTLVLSDVETLQGTSSTAPDGLLRVAVPAFSTSAGGRTVGEYLRLIPVGSSVAAYLERGWAVDGGLVNMHPGGADSDSVPLYIPTSSQSLAVQEVGVSSVTWPLVGVTKNGGLRDALPGGNLVPLVEN